MNNSFLGSYIDDDYRPVKRGLIVKHDPNRSFSRPGSVKKPRIPALLEKKVESLEKKQELWKEREQVWGKEKKNLQQALKNVIKTQAIKDPDEYYKNLLSNWHLAQKKIKPNVDIFYEGIEKLRGFLNWILDQHGDTPLKYIQKLADEHFLCLDKLEAEYRQGKEEREMNSNRVIESLKKENEQLTEKMTSGMQDVVNIMQIKIQELTNEIAVYEKDLNDQKVEYERALDELREVKDKFDVKEREIAEYKLNIQVLEEQIDGFKESIDAKKMINRLPLHEIAESSQQVIEKLTVQLREVEDENMRIRKMNEIYEFEIENLHKHKISQKVSKNCKKIDFFDLKNSATQTSQEQYFTDLDYVQLMSCLALGLEVCLQKPE
jgi:hypothetical protein